MMVGWLNDKYTYKINIQYVMHTIISLMLPKKRLNSWMKSHFCIRSHDFMWAHQVSDKNGKWLFRITFSHYHLNQSKRARKKERTKWLCVQHNQIKFALYRTHTHTHTLSMHCNWLKRRVIRSIFFDTTINSQCTENSSNFKFLVCRFNVSLCVRNSLSIISHLFWAYAFLGPYIRCTLFRCTIFSDIGFYIRLFAM